MKLSRNICQLTRGGRACYAVEFKRGKLRYWRLFGAPEYGGEESALAAATEKRDRIRAALGRGADAAWLFYVYGGAERPGRAPRNYIWR